MLGLHFLQDLILGHFLPVVTAASKAPNCPNDLATGLLVSQEMPLPGYRSCWTPLDWQEFH